MSTSRGRLSIGQTLGLLVAALLLLHGGVALGAVLRMSARNVTFQEGVRQVTSDPFGLGLAQLIALGSILLVGVRMAHGERSLRDALHIRPVRLPVGGLALLAGAALHFPFVELMSIVADLAPAIALGEEDVLRLEQLTRIDGPLRAFTVPLALVVIAPVTEELLFRGLLLAALRPQLGGTSAVALTAVLFGVFHAEPLAAIHAALVGLVLGALFLRCRSVLPSLAFHGAFNAMPILLPEELVPIPGFNVAQGEHLPVPIVFATFATGVLALGLLWRTTVPPHDEWADGEPPEGATDGDRGMLR